MSPVELIFVLLGVGILIASCFVGGKDKKSDAALLPSEEVIEGFKQEIKNYTERMMEEKSEEVVVRTDDYLSKISNEKIMSVNDFSAQILEKIDTNHKEVVFLYDMLNKKEDEIKQTVQQFDKEKQEMQEVVGEIIKLTKQMKATIQKNDEPKASSAEKSKKAETKKTATKTTVKTEKEKCRLVYSIFYIFYEDSMGHYCRHLYNIVKYIDSTKRDIAQFIYKTYANPEERREKMSDLNRKINCYVAFLQSSLSAYELTILFYNCTMFDKAKRLYQRYNLLENLQDINLFLRVDTTSMIWSV